MKWYETTFIYVTYIVYSLYIITFLGIWHKAASYLKIINFYRSIFVSLILLYLFHPWKKTKFTEFHRKVVFTAGMFLFTSTLLNIIIHYLKIYKIISL